MHGRPLRALRPSAPRCAPADLHGREALEDECADVLMYLLLIADRAGIDLEAATRAKLVKNEAKYPAECFRGSCRKYDAAG